ncbi:DUF5698 domain-containing protein [Alkaliphilus peptidifermentans]|uniref:Uncharacterized protein YebE, UPF0316 family n=1 Tax=Alkaliphilus peptidifermentans DSM 18978 TaxID=1120976 RepID=A0A1G5IIA5_9FIRM|nr:DUF5698 domain-containing protein [Alkaliphilus peptidifermentans]SCY75481.1 Uncharacterized protein YebE, UPF0316 family [Alkaliphilus peptidifermentans DSM 18978]
MTQHILLTLMGLFLITALTNILATLKSILLAKKIMNPVYFLVFADAIIFAAVVGKVANSEGVHFAVAYALGKTLGVFIGNRIEDKLALGILEVDVFLNNKDKMIQIAEKLREEGYTVNNFLARGSHGHRRYKIEVVIRRKEFKILEGIMEECGVTDPTLKIKNLNKVEGKISVTNVKAI